MITEFFLGLFADVADWFLGLFGTDDPPEWMTGVGDFVGELFARMQGLGAWVPFELLFGAAGTLLLIWAGFWLVKGIRWLWGLTPFSGGS